MPFKHTTISKSKGIDRTGICDVIDALSKELNNPVSREQYINTLKNDVVKSRLKRFEKICNMYIAGGAARDLLLGKADEIKDLDIYVTVDPSVYKWDKFDPDECDERNAEIYASKTQHHRKEFLEGIIEEARLYLGWTLRNINGRTNGPVIYSKKWKMAKRNGEPIFSYSSYRSSILSFKSANNSVADIHSYLGLSRAENIKWTTHFLFGTFLTKTMNSVFSGLKESTPANYDSEYDLPYALSVDVITRLMHCVTADERQHITNSFRNSGTGVKWQPPHTLTKAYFIQFKGRHYTPSAPEKANARRFFTGMYRIMNNGKSVFKDPIRQLKDSFLDIDGSEEILHNILGKDFIFARRTFAVLNEIYSLSAYVSNITKTCFTYSKVFEEDALKTSGIDVDMMLIPECVGGIGAYIDSFFDNSLSKCYIEDSKIYFSESFDRTIETGIVEYDTTRTNLLSRRNIQHTTRIMNKTGFDQLKLTGLAHSFGMAPHGLETFITQSFSYYLSMMYLAKRIEKQRDTKKADSDPVDTSAIVV